MLAWLSKLFAARDSTGMPQYRALRDTPSRPLPAELREREAAPAHLEASQALEQLFLTSRRPPVDQPLFVSLAGSGPGQAVTFPVSGGADHCLPVFTTPHHAADYVRTMIAGQVAVQYRVSSAIELTAMLHDLAPSGVRRIVVDRCPRGCPCTIFGTESIESPERALELWAIGKGIQSARAELYLEYALDMARTGGHEVAQAVLLESIGHVTMADPRPHFLLGRVSKALGDRRQAEEAAAFLRYLRMDDWAAVLEQSATTENSGGDVPWESTQPRS